MADNIRVEVESRTGGGKNISRRLRAAGMVPAIVYGLDTPPFSVSVNPRRIQEVLKLETGRNTIISLALADEADKQRAVMIREIQRDPVTEQMLHIDFVRVDMSKSVSVRVPIHLIGTPVGVKTEGGILEFMHRDVEVECLPSDIPDSIDFDISELHLNQNISVGDLPIGARVTLKEAPETIIALVAPPVVHEEEAKPEEEAEEAAAAAEAGAAEEKPADTETKEES